MPKKIRTAGRTKNAGLSLVMRRRWFAEGEENPPTTDPPAPEGDKLPDWVKDPAKAYDEIKKVRDEAATHRKKLRELETAEAKRQADAKAAEEQKLKEQGELQKLLEQRDKELAETRAKAAEAERKNLQVKAANAAGIPLELAPRLQGATEEELLADAQALKNVFDTQTKSPGGQKNTRGVAPSGSGVGETDEQRRARLRGGNRNIFGGK